MLIVSPASLRPHDEIRPPPAGAKWHWLHLLVPELNWNCGYAAAPRAKPSDPDAGDEQTEKESSHDGAWSAPQSLCRAGG